MHRIFSRWIVSLMLAIALLMITSVPLPAHAAGLWYVAPTGDDSNDCLSPGMACATINGAIGKAAAGDTINVAIGTYTGTNNEVILIDRDLTFTGGWDATFTAQSGISTIDGQAAIRGITITGGFTVRIERFIVQNSLGNGAGGIYNSGGVITLEQSIVSGNTSQGGGGGISNVFGGIFIINNSAVTGNRAAIGGGIANTGTSVLTLNNATISGNVADSRGGGVYNDTGTVHINNTTISGNNSTFGPGGGGIYNESGGVTVRNTILAGNTNDQNDGPDCEGTISSLGFNLLGNTTTCDLTPGTGDLTNVDPNLGQLIGPSGAPSYHPLFSTSPAIDAGNPAGCTDQDSNLLSTDQRGVARVGNCDIGSYEYTVPGTAVSLSAVGGNGQRSIATFAFSKPFEAAALDNQGSPVSGVTIDFAAPASGASGTFASTGTNTTSVNTNEGGVAITSTFTANDQAGAYTVSASAVGLGSVDFNLEQLARPANDDFSSATAATLLPFDDIVDTTTATMETSEPTPSCVFGNLTGSVWYAFTPSTSGSVAASAFNLNGVATLVAAYTGDAFANLTELGCQTFTSNPVTFHVDAGNTYYIQVGVLGVGLAGLTQFHIEVTPPPVADFFFFPNPPSVFDTIQFFDSSTDPGQVNIQTFNWDFGDGAISTESNPTHQYAIDGDYTVEHSITTLDGRTASTSKVFQVRTHDVSITKIAAPKSANSGQTKAITVAIQNTRYPETVRVDLYKSTPGGDVFIGTLTLQVPILRGKRTTQYTFNYTFTAEDAQIGKVSFRAEAFIEGANDAFPQDNTAISLPPTRLGR